MNSKNNISVWISVAGALAIVVILIGVSIFGNHGSASTTTTAAVQQITVPAHTEYPPMAPAASSGSSVSCRGKIDYHCPGCGVSRLDI